MYKMSYYYGDDLNAIKQRFTFIFKDYIDKCDGEYNFFIFELTRLDNKYRTIYSCQVIQNIKNHIQELTRTKNTTEFIRRCMISNINDTSLLHDLIKFTDVNNYSTDERINNLEKKVEELRQIIIENKKICMETNEINLIQNEILTDINENVNILTQNDSPSS